MITPTSKVNCVIVIERMSSSHPQKAMSCFPKASLGEKYIITLNKLINTQETYILNY